MSTEQGESILPRAVAVTVVAAAVTVASRLDRPRPDVRPTLVTTLLIVVALVAGTGATWSVVDVGHSGAKKTWTTVQDADTDDDDD